MKTKRLSVYCFIPKDEHRCPKKGEWFQFKGYAIVQALSDFEFEEFDIYERIERPTRWGCGIVAALMGLVGVVWIAVVLLVGGAR